MRLKDRYPDLLPAHVHEVVARNHREGFRHIGAALRHDLPPGQLAGSLGKSTLGRHRSKR